MNGRKLKKRARALMAEAGITYMQARQRILAEEGMTHEKAGALLAGDREVGVASAFHAPGDCEE